MSEQKKETVGAASLRLSQKTPDTLSPVELEREMHKDYEKHIYLCVEEHKKKFPGDFFIVVETKRERLMSNVLRNLFFARHSCPTPNYDQTVYKYHRDKDIVEFIWVIPSRDACKHLKDNVLYVASEEKELLKFVLDFADGTLMKIAKQLNNEE